MNRRTFGKICLSTLAYLGLYKTAEAVPAKTEQPLRPRFYLGERVTFKDHTHWTYYTGKSGRIISVSERYKTAPDGTILPEIDRSYHIAMDGERTLGCTPQIGMCEQTLIEIVDGPVVEKQTRWF